MSISKGHRLTRRIQLVSMIAAGLAAIVLLPFLQTDDSTGAGDQEPVQGRAHLDTLVQAYSNWERDYTSKYDGRVPVNLVWNKALSKSFTEGHGRAAIDLQGGESTVTVRGLENASGMEVWLVDNVPGDGRTTRPEPGDKLLRIGQLTEGEDGLARLSAKIDPQEIQDFVINWVVVSEPGEQPGEGGMLFGSTLLFQRLHHYVEREPDQDPESFLVTAMRKLVPTTVSAQGIVPSSFPDAALINYGRELFFFETFEGNGRTCGTCHPEDNNLTIDPEFIATLPNNDPLFVAEFVPALANNFEKPTLMREVALILENTNGFGDLANNFTMRSVPHTLAMSTSLEPTTADGTTIPPVERTGWSGDGSPLSGSLRDFAVGAVTQHFPKTTNRVDGVDFRLPTSGELDALEAFQLSLGRQSEFDDLSTITLTNKVADLGRRAFMGENLANGTACNACHFNAGANTDPAVFGEMKNRSFGPGHEILADQPALIHDAANFTLDDGFGSGTRLFNVPTVVEAADTGPFFHSNSVETVEGAVAFYSSQRLFTDGRVLPPITGLNGSQVAAVGAFMRVINADENVRSAKQLIVNGFPLPFINQRTLNLKLCRSELEDALRVLREGRLHFSDAVPAIEATLVKVDRAIATTSKSTRDHLMIDINNRLRNIRPMLITR